MLKTKEEKQKWLDAQNKALAKQAATTIFEKMDYEFFLNIFNDSFNWFGSLGLKEADYKQLSFEIKMQKQAIQNEYDNIETISEENSNVGSIIITKKDNEIVLFQILDGDKTKKINSCIKYDVSNERHYFIIREFLDKEINSQVNIFGDIYTILDIKDTEDVINELMLPDLSKTNSSYNQMDVALGYDKQNDLYELFYVTSKPLDEKHKISFIPFITPDELQKSNWQILNVMSIDTFDQRFHIEKQKEKTLVLK